jgi:hypothetical protein
VKAKPVPFSSHIEILMQGFRTSMPQVAALLQFMPEELLVSVEKELRLLHETTTKELSKREVSR